MVLKIATNKKQLGIKAINSSRQANTRSTIQNLDTNSKGDDFRAINITKHQSNKRSDSETSPCLSSRSQKASRLPGKPPTLVTPKPKKSTSCKCSDTSPNYMKSTSSSEARKAKTTQSSSILSATKLHKVVKSSSLEKVRTLTKAPNFKHTRTSTCSSTIKSSEFPPYLELDTGATEAKGKSVLRVCSYDYCSLNSHHQKSASPLKRFISTRRRQLKSPKVNRPEVLALRKRKTGVADTVEDFFIEIIIRDKEVVTQVSESLSDGPCSEIDFQGNVDHNAYAASSAMNFIYETSCTPSSVQNQPLFRRDLGMESSTTVSLEEFCENSDIEWVEGQTYSSSNNVEILNEIDCSDDHRKPGFEIEDKFCGYIKGFQQYPPYFQDEIVEFLCSSDAYSVADSESTQPDEYDIKQGGSLSNLVEQVKELQNGEDLIESHCNGSDKDKCMEGETKEENAADLVVEERKLNEKSVDNATHISENAGALIAKATTCNGNGLHVSTEVQPHSHENNVVEDKTFEMGEDKSTEEADATPETRNKILEPTKFIYDAGDSNQELLERCNRTKRVMRSRKEDNDAKEAREFNPRGPNFLEIEPDPEAEKVDLRHQEMDDRRNAEEWMLDYALQKTVNQLAPARNKKVALLVEAYEAVLPVPKWEP